MTTNEINVCNLKGHHAGAKRDDERQLDEKGMVRITS